MNKYGDIALRAVKLILYKEQSEPLTAWSTVASDVFGEGTWAQRKGCPKNAFLGLCEAGFIKDIPKGNYTYKPNSLNKGYAVKAIELLRVNPELAIDKNELWKTVIGKDDKKSHNSQMDVVLALWGNNLIVSDEITGYVATTKKDR